MEELIKVILWLPILVLLMVVIFYIIIIYALCIGLVIKKAMDYIDKKIINVLDKHGWLK